jgi:putative ABC transport system permease protein
VLTATAIAVGVALGFAVHLVNGSALTSFERAVRTVSGAAEFSVRAATPLGFDEMLYPHVAMSSGVADASPVVQLPARIGNARFTLLGLDVLRAVAVTPNLVGVQRSGPDLRNDHIFGEAALFLSRGAMQATGARPGQEIAVTANGRTVPLLVAGTLPAVGEGQTIGVMDIAAAQWRFGRLGRLDRIDLTLSDREAAEIALAGMLPAGTAVTSAETVAAQGGALSRAYRVNLDMLALVALLTGGFLVFSAQSLSVSRRLRSFALIRTLGLPRQGVVAAVSLEGLLIGILGATLGLIAGYVLAYAALRWFGADLGAGYFSGHQRVDMVFQPAAAVRFFALGLLAAVLGSLIPARAAARAAPAAALKNTGDLIDPRRPVPWRPALALLTLGALAAILPAVGELPLFGFASMGLLLAGGVASVPWLARLLLGAGGWRPIAHVPALLAVRHIHGAPGEAATALCGIVASTALMIAMATMVTSFRGAVDGWLGQVLSADLYLRVENGGGLDVATQARLRTTPGVARVAFSRQLPLMIAPDRPPVTLIARPVGREMHDPPMVLIDTAEALPAGAARVWVSEPAQRLYGWNAGDLIALPIAEGQQFAVAGVWRDYARQAGAVVISQRDYVRLTGDMARDEASVTLMPGADPRRVGRSLEARVSPELGARVAEPATLRRFALTLFDRSFAVTYLLEAVAILVGLAGVAATMSAQTIARAREFGMLRHLGVTKAQIISTLGIEGAILGLIGAVAGVGLGLVLSQVLIHVINPQSFNWTMATLIPVNSLLNVVVALVIAAAGTAVLAGRRATGIDAVRAVREDW